MLQIFFLYQQEKILILTVGQTIIKKAPKKLIYRINKDLTKTM